MGGEGKHDAALTDLVPSNKSFGLSSGPDLLAQFKMGGTEPQSVTAIPAEAVTELDLSPSLPEKAPVTRSRPARVRSEKSLATRQTPTEEPIDLRHGPRPLPASTWPTSPSEVRVDDCILDALWQLEGADPHALLGEEGFGADDITMMAFILYSERATFRAGRYFAPNYNAVLAKLTDQTRGYWRHELIKKINRANGPRYQLSKKGRDYLLRRDRRQLPITEIRLLTSVVSKQVKIDPLQALLSR